MQDPVFAIDQLVEIAIRALSPGGQRHLHRPHLHRLAGGGTEPNLGRDPEEGVYRDRFGRVRLIESDPSYAHMVNRAFDKVRQAARAMPAVIIRMMDALTTIMEETTSPDQRRILMRQADMILLSAKESVTEPNDLTDISSRYERTLQQAAFDDPGAA